MSKNEEFESELFQNLDMEDKEHLNQQRTLPKLGYGRQRAPEPTQQV